MSAVAKLRKDFWGKKKTMKASKELKETLSDSEFKGYLKAKREMVGAIDSRTKLLQDQVTTLTKDGRISSGRLLCELDTRIAELEKIRDYIRNSMLWKRED